MTKQQERLNELCLRADDLVEQVLDLLYETRGNGGDTYHAQKACDALREFQTENYTKEI